MYLYVSVDLLSVVGLISVQKVHRISLALAHRPSCTFFHVGGLQDKSTIVKGTSYTLLWKEIGLLYTLLHKKFYV